MPQNFAKLLKVNKYTQDEFLPTRIDNQVKDEIYIHG